MSADEERQDSAGFMDGDDELADPEFQALLLYIERLATRMVEQINAKHQPSEPQTQDEQGSDDTTDEPADEPIPPEPGTDAYDDIHGIPCYDLE